MGQFTNKVAIVTGGASCIGRVTAVAFTREGAKVVVADVNVEEGEETVNVIQQSGGDAVFVKTDVVQPDQVQVMVTKTVEAFGRLDYAFNNAGILGQLAPTVDCTEENWDRMTGIHLKGILLCMKYEIPQMLKHDAGAIVNTASIAGLVALSGISPAYVASKYSIIALSKSTALAYRTRGIRINVMCPGWIHTPLQAQVNQQWMARLEQEGLVGEPHDIAEAVL